MMTEHRSLADKQLDVLKVLRQVKSALSRDRRNPKDGNGTKLILRVPIHNALGYQLSLKFLESNGRC